MEPVSVRTWKISYYSYMFLHIFLVLGFFGDFRCSAQVLPNDEVQALHRISLKLRIAQWNVNKDSCVTSEDLNMEFRPEILSNVTCDCSFENSTLCHVTRITLNGMNATGELPNEFANLTYLSYIDLSRNFLYGSIPSRWGLLPLITLDLSENLINGTIPREMGNISTLEELNLQDNGIGGSLPQELGKLHALRIVILSSNNFQGSLPETFGNLKNLTDFRIDGSSISGRIPGFIGNWTKLRWLGLQGTSMVGPIPSTISLLRNLVRLRITDLNTTNMSIPDLRNLENLVQLVLRNCSLNGSVPLYIGKKLLNLKKLDLSFNRLTGAIPENLGTLPNLSYMYLTNNSLDGEVPQWLSTGRSNILVDISYNNFTGVSQSSCGEKNMNKLSSYSSVKDNTINWCLKKDLPCPDKPRYYNLFINCGGPNLSFEGINYEQDLDGMGPASSFSTVKWASSCTGDFFTHDKILYIAEKSGNSAADLYLTARLAPLSLKYYGRCLRSGSYTVKLHFAEIMLRTDLRNNTVGKRIFDIYIQGARVWKDFNIAEEAGGIDIGIVKEFQANVTGNTLEIHLYWSGKGTISLPVKGVYGPLISAISVTPNFDPHTGLSIAIILGIVAGSAVAILLVLVALWRTGYLGRRDIDEELRGLLCYFTLGQIKAATGNFDTANKIGEGGFGPVYKGILSDGSAIAVKQLSPRSKQGNREFLNEIGMLSAVQHPNLVKLFGCCIEGNQLMLIYEYMANNSLHRALFEPRTTLDWPTRLKICMGIAKGLAYLHEESILKIVHRDMKASNVLLDKDLEAKISDFGLAKLDEEVNTHISTRIAGTVGYMAPEYAMRGYLTNKADIYSFGVVALEIISGKSNTSFRPKEEFVFLLDWAIVLQEQGNLLELIDPRLEPNYSEEEALKMINIALLCTNISPTLRPAMSSVVKMLEGQIPVQAPIVKGSSVTQDISDPSVKGISFDVSSNHHPFSLSSEEDIKSDSPTSKLLSDDESAYFTGLQA